MDIGQWGEQRWIEFLQTRQVLGPNVTGIGDDCAVFPKNEYEAWLVTTDSMVEGVHFKKNHGTAKTLGQKILQVNISDIAAMGGHPAYLWLNVSCPHITECQWLQDFAEVIMQACQTANIQILGGDTTASLDSLFLNLVLLGEMSSQDVKYRYGAKEGDLIFCTGELGLAHAGLEMLEDKSDLFPELAQAFLSPRAHLEEGQWLAKQASVHSMMDCSDGLYNDLPKLLGRDKLGATIHIDTFIPNPALLAFCQQDKQKAWEMMICGGEDYCLLGTADKTQFAALNQDFKMKFQRPLTVLGVVNAQAQIEYRQRGHIFPLKLQPFHHFAKA